MENDFREVLFLVHLENRELKMAQWTFKQIIGYHDEKADFMRELEQLINELI